MSAPRQLALDFVRPHAPSFGNFVAGRNAETLAALRAVAAGHGEAFIYLWGSPGSGRTHLLSALAAEAGAALGPATVPLFAPGARLYLADDVERFSAAEQQQLFVLMNEVRAQPGTALVAAGNAPPGQLALREDVRTRLAWGLVYQTHALSDEEKAQALARHAQSRGLTLPAEVVAYLLNHMPRDMRTLVAILDALDAYALAAKRPITVPLVREWSQSGA